MRITRMAAMAAAAVFVVGCSENTSVTDLRPSMPETVSLASGSAASFTTVDDAGDCANGTGTVNCNIYASKGTVYLNGGPVGSGLDDGTYFWAIVVPGSQSNVADGLSGNLSDDVAGGTTGDDGAGDVIANRTFTVSGGVLTYDFLAPGAHQQGSNTGLIQLAPFSTTSNGGGGYILAICAFVDGKPGKCKYDAFKVNDDAGSAENVLVAPIPTKTAVGSYTRTYNWTIAKSVDGASVKAGLSSVTFNYNVVVTKTGFTDSKFVVTGLIGVLNPNADPIAATITDAMDGASCVVTDGDAATLVSGPNNFEYTCTFAAAPTTLTGITNTVTVEWLAQEFGADPVRTLAAGTASFAFPDVPFTATEVNSDITVTDVFNLGSAVTLGTTNATTTYSYSTTVSPVVANTCTNYVNTATITQTAQTSSQTVTACGPVTSGLTIGFWQNKNGQDAIKGGPATAGVCNLTGYLRGLGPITPATVGNAFSDLSATASCSTVATYVTGIIKTASAAGDAMNPMLRAQYLATALSVYHSREDVKRIPGPSLGGIKIDLTKVCILSSADCSVTQNVSAAFGGASAMTVSEMLTHAGKQATTARGAMWYANIKATQELAKNAFDVINNKKAFVAP